MRFLNCICGLITCNIISKINYYPVILNTRFTSPLFNNNDYDKFNYGSEERRRFKDLSKIRYFVQDHHCIPRQFRNHKLLREINFDVNSSRNILIMPTRLGIKELKLDPNCLVHEGGHPKYNKYVGSQLEKIKNKYETIDEQRYQIWLFLHHLKDNLHYKNYIIPWE
jgi:hypothetical protein